MTKFSIKKNYMKKLYKASILILLVTTLTITTKAQNTLSDKEKKEASIEATAQHVIRVQ